MRFEVEVDGAFLERLDAQRDEGESRAEFVRAAVLAVVLGGEQIPPVGFADAPAAGIEVTEAS